MSEPATTTIQINGARRIPSVASAYSYEVPLRDAIAAVQDAGYLVYEKSELPEVTVNGEGRPRLPAHWGEHREGVDHRTARYEEAFGKLALALWWEEREAELAKLRADMVADLGDRLSPQAFTELRAEYVAKFLIERGWRK